MTDRSKKGRSQLDLGLRGVTGRPGPERTLEVDCSNCGARFVAYYGYDEENVEVRSCGLCHGEEFRRDCFKSATIGLVAQVTARRCDERVITFRLEVRQRRHQPGSNWI